MNYQLQSEQHRATIKKNKSMVLELRKTIQRINKRTKKAEKILQAWKLNGKI